MANSKRVKNSDGGGGKELKRRRVTANPKRVSVGGGLPQPSQRRMKNGIYGRNGIQHEVNPEESQVLRNGGLFHNVREEEQSLNVNGSNGDCDDRSISLTLTDPDLLDCPICFENLSIPVFQCQNGHLACSACCNNLQNKCPSCSSIGFHSCRAIEKILESLKVSCRNMKYGCTEMVFYSQKHDHEDVCINAPCLCPLPDCDFVGSSKNLSLHFSYKHSNSATSFCYNSDITISLDKQQKYFILQEQEEGTLFVLNNGVQILGNAINVSCIAQSSSKIGFSYDLLARNGGSSVKLESFTEFVPAWVEHLPLRRFLVVPSDFVGSCGKLNLGLCIWGKLPHIPVVD